MATYLISTEGTVTLTGSGNVPTAANIARAQFTYSKVPVRVTPLGSTSLKYRLGLPRGGGTIDVLIDDDASTPPAPDGVDATLTCTVVSGQSYAGTIKLYNARLVGFTGLEDTQQIIRYDFVWNSTVTVT